MCVIVVETHANHGAVRCLRAAQRRVGEQTVFESIFFDTNM